MVTDIASDFTAVISALSAKVTLPVPTRAVIASPELIFASVAKLTLPVITAKSSVLAAVITALLGGQIHMALVPPGLAMPHVKTGRLRVIGLTGGRSTLVPELGALSEIGVKNFNLEVWTALIGPASLSQAAQARLAHEVPAVVRSAATRQRLFTQGWNAVGSSLEGLRLRVADESAILGGIIKSANIKTE